MDSEINQFKQLCNFLGIAIPRDDYLKKMMKENGVVEEKCDEHKLSKPVIFTSKKE